MKGSKSFQKKSGFLLCVPPGHNYNQYFGKIKLCKFKDGADPSEIFQMFIWIVDGYIHERQMVNKPLCLDEIGKMLTNWTEMLKQIAYKEEYL